MSDDEVTMEAEVQEAEVDADGIDSVSASASSPVRRRRGLKRSSAACHRCRLRKQKASSVEFQGFLDYADA
jgi:hypothetical protein